MGLPLFITPVEPDEAVKSIDKTAANSRSAIRRQRAVRRPNNQSRTEERNVLIHSAGFTPSILPDYVPDFSDIVPNIGEAELERLRATVAETRRLHDLHRSSRVHDTTRFRTLPEPSSLNATREAHRMMAQRYPPSIPPDAPLNVPPTTSFTSAPIMPPVPESRDFQGNPPPILHGRRPRRPSEYRRRDLYQRVANPSLARIDTSGDLTAGGLSTQMPALTPNFSPARRYALEEARIRPRSDSPPNFSYYPYYAADRDQILSLGGLRSPSNDLRSHREFPPLRRVGRRNIAEYERRRLRAARVDGLGDRERSLSLDGDGAWETMLTTLTPDPQLPSAGSSFASASAATSASSNAESSSTLLTAMDNTPNSADPISPGLDNICDLIDESLVSSDTEDTEDDSIYDHAARDIYRRSYANVMAARDEIVNLSGAADTDTLGSMQHFVRRLARREDIPDEWWAEVGLSRTFSQDTGRL